MTDRLYFSDSSLREFSATVLSCEPAPANRHAVLLDRTAFYPTSGGQPHDLGALGDARILEVLDRDDGAIAHFTDRPLPLSPTRGLIDWPRRFDHMQQHTGQHLLSAAFIELFNFPTVSFHLGAESSTIDLAAPSLSPQQLEAAERRANEIIFDDRPVTISFATAAELAALGVRKQLDREGPLRVITIEDFDRQPCGGTHVARTGQIGLTSLRKIEKQKSNVRVEFVCGHRALAAARADAAILAEAARLLTCGAPEIPANLAKALSEKAAAFKSQQEILSRLAAYEAQSLLAVAETLPSGARLVRHILPDSDAAYLRLLATRIVSNEKTVALLAARSVAVPQGGTAHPAGNVIFAQSPGLPFDMNALLREALTPHGGKGGGARDFAQGFLPDASQLDAALSTASSRLS